MAAETTQGLGRHIGNGAKWGILSFAAVEGSLLIIGSALTAAWLNFAILGGAIGGAIWAVGRIAKALTPEPAK